MLEALDPSNATSFLFHFAYQYEGLVKVAMSYLCIHYNLIKETRDFVQVLFESNVNGTHESRMTLFRDILHKLNVVDFDPLSTAIIEKFQFDQNGVGDVFQELIVNTSECQITSPATSTENYVSPIQ